ncbi:aromatic ring-hydroxylating dioxygenase subunit alpha [Variovorax sp. J31P207]|uniref:aromatic ring-hydroxylating dioxygenase subunit alpha n=1 Tax=Variovorax sp. J31P207 TaxID=3053510 RepID=UPI0025755DFB|nr:aromatic ring-hydroxylating dioxygenase subunit alpha [Variovorax sp. J31P207]MDM0065191.1 aromatic ring-hydroxylating dioxygenase subunit alpha [Variovorax sp. J31P207]
MNTASIPVGSIRKSGAAARFPLDRWYVAGFSSELQDQPIGRTFLNQKVVLFRTGGGEIAALEDRCCHRSLPLSCGTVEADGVRCGYHGLLYAPSGQCLEIPGQERIPSKARVRSYRVVEKDRIVWIWMPRDEGSAPDVEPPDYPHHDDPRYKFGSGMYHYKAPWQLIHDNLLDLSHLGYVHLKTIGGNARLHMNAPMKVTQDGDTVKVVRLMPGSTPPPTYCAAWPFGDTCDRWQEIEFHVSHLAIWTGAMEPGSGAIDDPQRGGFHMRGFHGITPETEDTCHYFWSMASNKHPDMPENIDTVVEQTAYTFDEDRVVIEDQYRNIADFGDRNSWMDIHVDAGANRARRIVERLLADVRPEEVAG